MFGTRRRRLLAVFALAMPFGLPAPAAEMSEPEFAKAASEAGARPVIDNERVTVWETQNKLPPAPLDFVAVPLSKKGTAVFGHKGDSPGEAGSRSVVILFKDHVAPPVANTSGYPNAFPRPRAVKLLENDKAVTWTYRWNLDEPTAMHFHDRDVIVVYQDDTALKSITPDGKTTTNEYKDGDVRFNRANRTHSELLMRDTGSAVMTELK